MDHGIDTIFFISVAARMLGMHPQTLRKYERLGLVQPTRTIGSMRLYSREELERLKLIKRLVDDGGHQPGRRAAAALDRRDRAAHAAADARRAAFDAARRGDCAQELDQLRRHARVRLDMDFKDYYSTLGVAKTRHREGNQAGVSASWRASTIPTSIRATSRPRRVQGDQRGLRGARRSRKRKKYDELGANWRMYEQAGAGRRAAAARLERELRRRRPAAASAR